MTESSEQLNASGKALHYYVTDDRRDPLPSTEATPNPVMWELKRGQGGFILVETGEEVVSDQDLAQ